MFVVWLRAGYSALLPRYRFLGCNRKCLAKTEMLWNMGCAGCNTGETQQGEKEAKLYSWIPIPWHAKRLQTCVLWLRQASSWLAEISCHRNGWDPKKREIFHSLFFLASGQLVEEDISNSPYRILDAQENHSTSKRNECYNSPGRSGLFMELFIVVKLFRECCILSAADLVVVVWYATPIHPYYYFSLWVMIQILKDC